MRAVVKYAKGLSYLLFSESTGFVIEKLISLILEGVRQKNVFLLYTRNFNIFKYFNY